MQLKEIYYPIRKELEEVSKVIESSLFKTKHESILKINRFLLESPGKRLRPALVFLSAKAVLNRKPLLNCPQLVKTAAAIELIHAASLIHDDVIDHAEFRHNRLSVNSKWGQDTSIALGDYLYSRAFELVSSCHDPVILNCISQATTLMCEGELLQIRERENISLLKKHYLFIVKSKTASLFAASCQVGAMFSSRRKAIHGALKEYGLNLGIAFQMMDDCLDLVGGQKALGKGPGADFKMGELTLPVLNLLSQGRNKEKLKSLVKQADKLEAFKEIRRGFKNSRALFKTKAEVVAYARKAQSGLNKLSDSDCKRSLFGLADLIIERLDA